MPKIAFLHYDAVEIKFTTIISLLECLFSLYTWRDIGKPLHFDMDFSCVHSKQIKPS